LSTFRSLYGLCRNAKWLAQRLKPRYEQGALAWLKDLRAEIVALAEKGVETSEVQEARWGSITKIRLPGGGEAGLYQPKHATALNIASK
jgi:hypothetical protein